MCGGLSSRSQSAPKWGPLLVCRCTYDEVRCQRSVFRWSAHNDQTTRETVSSPKFRFIQIATAAIAVIVVITLTNAITTGSTRAWWATLSASCSLVVGLIGWWQVKNEQKRQDRDRTR